MLPKCLEDGARLSERQRRLSARRSKKSETADGGEHLLCESLRPQHLWERSQKRSTANAVLKRRHTSHDVQLKVTPGEAIHERKEQR